MVAPDSLVLSRRGRLTLRVLIGLLALMLLLSAVVAVWTDWLWYDELGFTAVMQTELLTRLSLLVVFWLVVGGMITGNLFLAYRLRPLVPSDLGLAAQSPLMRYRMLLANRVGRVFVVAGILLGFFFGLSAQSQWREWLLFMNSQDFGVKDPQFGVDIGFYVFELPFWQFLLGTGFTLITIALLGSLVVHFLYGGLRLSGHGDRITPAARAQITVLIGLFVGLKAVAYFFDKRSLLLGHVDTYDFYGAGYSDIEALVPAKDILTYLAIVVALAIVIFSNAVMRNLVWPGVSLGLLAIAAVVIGGVYPWSVQSFKVEQTQTLEVPYAQRAIEATRQAYGLSGVDTVNYEAGNTTPPASLATDKKIVSKIRLLDPVAVGESFDQLEQVRSWYSFGEALDIDRYTINGETRDYVVGLRALDYSKLSDAQKNWQNLHTVYTHGYGFVAAPADTICDGKPCFVSGSLNSAKGVDSLPVSQPRVYYGEGATEYAVVGHGKNAKNVEYDRPTSTVDAQYYVYDGKGGVKLDSTWRRMLYALDYQETRFLLSDAVSSDSRIMYVRQPRERVQKVAPFLTLDGDPYPAVVDGRIVWIVDGYTTATHYPYAHRIDLRVATSDSHTGTGAVAQSSQVVTYMRNSVKATVDAYDGTVTLYEFDEHDPVLKAWDKALGGIITPKSAISPALAAHFRYPEDLFKVQRDLLTRYHMINAADFAVGPDRWKVPTDPTAGGSGKNQPPYYLVTAMPGQDQPEFQLVAALTPNKKENLAALLSGRYVGGKPRLSIFELPRDTQIAGPGLAQQKMENETDARTELKIWGNTAIRGNLLSLPFGDGMLYVEPIYLRSTEANGYPQLKRVIVSYGEKVGYADTLPAAIAELLGNAPPPQNPPTTTPPPTTPPGTGSDLSAAAAKVQKAIEALRAAQQSGDFAAYGKALADLDAAIKEFQAASASVGSPSPAPSVAP